jgi:hypothetical protein
LEATEQAKPADRGQKEPAAGVGPYVEADEAATAAAGVPTVARRMDAAGMATERVREHLAASRVRLDGVAVAVPNTPASPPARIVINTN